MSANPGPSSSCPEPIELIEEKPEKVNVERFTYDWIVTNFKDEFLSAQVPAEGAGVSTRKMARARRRNVSERDIVAMCNADTEWEGDSFMCGQLVERTSEWRMDLIKKGSHLSVSLACLRCFHENVNEIWVRFDVDIIDLNGTVVYSEGGPSFFHENNLTNFMPRNKVREYSGRRNSLWETDVISMVDLSKNWDKLVLRNTLNLRLRLYVYKEKPSNEAAILATTAEAVQFCYKPLSHYFNSDLLQKISLMRNMQTLWETKEDSDVSISVNGTIIKAHKLILSLQSPVLKSMLKKAEAEGQHELVLDVSNESIPALEFFLEYLYTENGEKLASLTDLTFISKVLNISKKFEIKSLQNTCRARLLAIMAVANFGDIVHILLSNMSINDDTLLKDELRKYFLENQFPLKHCENFKNYVKANKDEFLGLYFEKSPDSPDSHQCSGQEDPSTSTSGSANA